MIAQGSVVKAYDIKGDGSIENYVRGLYFQLLNREPDQAGFDSWIDGYYYGGYTASDIARGFFFSPEYTTESRIIPSTNRQFVWDCYMALLGRGPSKGELDKYVDYINRGIHTREEVLEGVLTSQEFLNLCDEWNIIPY